MAKLVSKVIHTHHPDDLEHYLDKALAEIAEDGGKIRSIRFSTCYGVFDDSAFVADTGTVYFTALLIVEVENKKSTVEDDVWF